MPPAAEESLREHGIVFKAREPKDDKPYEDSITLDVVMEDEGEYFNTSVRGVVTEGIPMVSRLNNFNGPVCRPARNDHFPALQGPSRHHRHHRFGPVFQRHQYRQHRRPGRPLHPGSPGRPQNQQARFRRVAQQDCRRDRRHNRLLSGRLIRNMLPEPVRNGPKKTVFLDTEGERSFLISA